MKSIIYYSYPPASLSVDHALGDLLGRQATLVVGRRRTHSKDGVVGRCILARTVLGVRARPGVSACEAGCVRARPGVCVRGWVYA
jgi:hypothetical protein